MWLRCQLPTDNSSCLIRRALCCPNCKFFTVNGRSYLVCWPSRWQVALKAMRWHAGLIDVNRNCNDLIVEVFWGFWNEQIQDPRSGSEKRKIRCCWNSWRARLVIVRRMMMSVYLEISFRVGWPYDVPHHTKISRKQFFILQKVLHSYILQCTVHRNRKIFLHFSNRWMK